MECARIKSRAQKPIRHARRALVLAAKKAEDPRIVTLPEAKALGLSRYFSGDPCRRGHVDERWVSSHQCVSCAREIGVSDENRARQRAWARANPEKIRAYGKAAKERDPEKYRLMHKRKREVHGEKYAAYKASYTEANRARIRATDALYRKENAEKVRGARLAWMLANPDKVRGYRLRRYWADPATARQKKTAHYWLDPDRSRIMGRVAANKRRALKAAAIGSYTKDDISRILDAQKGRCAICRTNIRKRFQIDHIVPLAKGGSNFPSNLQILCKTCNCRKQAKDPIDFMRSIGRLL